MQGRGERHRAVTKRGARLLEHSGFPGFVSVPTYLECTCTSRCMYVCLDKLHFISLRVTYLLTNFLIQGSYSIHLHNLSHLPIPTSRPRGYWPFLTLSLTSTQTPFTLSINSNNPRSKISHAPIQRPLRSKLQPPQHQHHHVRANSTTTTFSVLAIDHDDGW